MAELKKIYEALFAKFSEKAGLRKDVVTALFKAFSGKTTSAEKIRNVQDTFRESVKKILKNLTEINEYIARDAKQFITDIEVAHAARLIEYELVYFQDIKEKFFDMANAIRLGNIDMGVIEERLSMDKIRSVVLQLNSVVRDEYNVESEINFLKSLNAKKERMAA